MSSQCDCLALQKSVVKQIAVLFSIFSCNIYSLDTIGEEVRFVSMHNDNIEEVPPVFSHHVCHSFIPAYRKGKNRLQQDSLPLLCVSMDSRREPEIANTYTKPKGLLVMRKSFFPWLTSRCKTASVSSPLTMNLSMKRTWTECYFMCSKVLVWYKKRRVFLPRSSMTHLYMYPLRWTMPIASWGLNKCHIETTVFFMALSLRQHKYFDREIAPNFKRRYPFYERTH